MKTKTSYLIISLLAFCIIADAKAQEKRYHDIIFEKSQVEKNIMYRETVNQKGESVNLSLDIYTPQTDIVKKRAAIMLIHGGAFLKGNDKTQSYISFLARNFARRGYVAISIDYRIRQSEEEDYTLAVRNAVEDSATAFKWIIENSGKYNIDTSKLIILGGSAGGITATHLCYGINSENFFKLKSEVKAVINCWGSESSSTIPADITKVDPPMLILHGTADQIVPFENSIAMRKMLNGKGISVSLHPLVGGNHPPSQHLNEVADIASDYMYNVLFGVNKQ